MSTEFISVSTLDISLAHVIGRRLLPAKTVSISSHHMWDFRWKKYH